MSDDNGPEIDEDAIDRLGRDAGAQLRRPAPESGVQRIAATARRRRTTRSAVVGGLALAALVGAGTVIVLARRPSDSVHTTPSIPTIAPSPSSPASTAPTVPPSTTATTSSIPTSTTTPTNPPQVAEVSYLSPPPELTLQAVTSLTVPEPTVGGYSVAVGNLGIAVGSSNYSDLAPVRIDIVGFDGQVRSLNGPEGTAGGSVSIIAYGPGDVVYASRPGESVQDFSVVALALSGPNAGDVVASTPQNVNRFLEYPRSSFGHSASGIADRRSAGLELTPSTPYVDVYGNPVSPDATPAWFTLESPEPGESSHGGIVTSSTGVSWSLEVEAAPDRASPYEGNSPPAAGPNGSGVYWTHVGPNSAPDQDFGEPTMWVIAEMKPDGSATWWSLPDGWQVLASDLWGTVLGKQEGPELQLALADFGSGARDPAFDPLADWPSPPTAAPTLGSAPYLLPRSAVAEAVAVELYENPIAASLPYDSYVQSFAIPGSDGYVAIRTVLGGDAPATSPGSLQSLSVPGWEGGTVTSSDEGATVALSSALGRVEIVVLGDPQSHETATALAEGLVRRDPPGTGWDLSLSGSPASLRPLSEGWAGPRVQRVVQWLGSDAGPIARLTITVGQPHVAESRVTSLPEVVGAIDGSVALGQVIPDRGSVVSWSPSPGLTVAATTRGSVADTISFASTIGAVDRTEWEASGLVLPPRTESGCD